MDPRRLQSWLMLQVAYKRRVVTLHDFIRLAFNAGFRGRALDPTAELKAD